MCESGSHIVPVADPALSSFWPAVRMQNEIAALWAMPGNRDWCKCAVNCSQTTSATHIPPDCDCLPAVADVQEREAVPKESGHLHQLLTFEAGAVVQPQLPQPRQRRRTSQQQLQHCGLVHQYQPEMSSRGRRAVASRAKPSTLKPSQSAPISCSDGWLRRANHRGLVSRNFMERMRAEGDAPVERDALARGCDAASAIGNRQQTR